MSAHRELPTLTDEEEATLIRQHRAFKRLGGKAVHKIVVCPRCHERYRAGSGHRGSLYCDMAQRTRVLRERGLTTVSFAYIDWLRAAGIPYEVHFTAARFVQEKAFRGVGTLEPRLWVPNEVNVALCKKVGVVNPASHVTSYYLLPKAERMRMLVSLGVEKVAEWAAAGVGEHGQKSLT